MAARPLKDSEKRPEILYRSIISSSGTTTTTKTIELPDGAYYLSFFGTQVAGTTDHTLSLSTYVNAAQTDQNALLVGLSTDVVWGTAADLEVAQTAIVGYAATLAQTAGGAAPMPIPVPYGIQSVYTKNGGSAVDLTLMAVRAR